MVWLAKTVVITGGATDLGQAIGKRFADQGAMVVLADHARARLLAARAAVGGLVYPALADVRDESHLARLFSALDAVDVLVCCSSAAPAGANALEAMPASALVDLFEVGVYGSYWAARHALPKMRAGGSIVFVSRGLARAGAQRVVGGAVDALTRALAAEIAGRAVRVNGVALAERDDDAVEAVQFLAGASAINGAVVAFGAA